MAGGDVGGIRRTLLRRMRQAARQIFFQYKLESDFSSVDSSPPESSYRNFSTTSLCSLARASTAQRVMGARTLNEEHGNTGRNFRFSKYRGIICIRTGIPKPSIIYIALSTKCQIRSFTRVSKQEIKADKSDCSVAR